jgi:4a-hydroxytetrahydrobiopterin dehydratase
MRMRPFSRNRKIVTRAVARNAALANQLATPGLGSLMAGRWIAGTGQLILSSVGCIMILIWFFKVMIQYYGQIGVIGEAQPIKINWNTLIIGAILFAIAWLWSGVTSISLFREASKGAAKSNGKSAAPPMPKFDAAHIALALASVPGWKLQDATISRTFQFKDFPAAMKFVDAVADLAEKSWHHPDIDIRWNKVALTLTTHDVGGLTQKDFSLAKQFDELSLL